MLRKILLATAISGTLDILWAISLTIWKDRSVPDMLRFVASGPFPSATGWGSAGAILGLMVHFGLMAAMATFFMVAWSRFDTVQGHPLLSGVGYGLVTYAVLDLVVVPLRFPSAWPPSSVSIVTQLFAHLILVGLVFATIARQSAQALQVGMIEDRAPPIARNF